MSAARANVDRDRAIVRRVLAGETCAEVARSLGLTDVRVSQIVGDALRPANGDPSEVEPPTPEVLERNREIVRRARRGESHRHIAQVFGLHRTRVSQIVRAALGDTRAVREALRKRRSKTVLRDAVERRRQAEAAWRRRQEEHGMSASAADAYLDRAVYLESAPAWERMAARAGAS